MKHVFLLLTYLLSTYIFYAQNNSSESQTSTIKAAELSYKLGPLVLGQSSRIIRGVEFSLSSKKLIYSIEYYKGDEFTIFFFGDSPSEYFHHFGVLIGDQKKRFRYHAGIAAFWGLERVKRTGNIFGSGYISGGTYQAETFFEPGIVSKLEFDIVNKDHIRFGVDLHSNLNLKSPVLFPMLYLGINFLNENE